MSHGCAYSIIHNDLRYRKVCSRWVPTQLSDDHKHAWQKVCQEHLDCHAHEGDAFLHWIVTGDESWVYHDEPERKRQSMQWKHQSSLANKKFKTGFLWEIHADHLLGCQWPVLMHFQEKGQTVTSAWYSDMLVNELKPTIQLKCWGLLSKRVLLLHDNAHPRMAAHTVDTRCALKCEMLKHRPYSPDLAPLDFHLFGPWKNICGARRLQMTMM
jgi:hypothetical protein